MSGQAQKTVAIFFILTGFYVECKNVVFLPIMATSHARLHALVAEELAKMGHNVWLVLPSALEKRKAESYGGVKTINYSEFQEISEDHIIQEIENAVNQAVISGTGEPDYEWVRKSDVVFSENYFNEMKNGKMIKYMENLKTDLIILDWHPPVNERVAISYKLKVPFAFLSPFQNHVTGKIPFNPVAEAYNSRQFRNSASLFEQVLTVINLMCPLFLHIFNDRGYMKQLMPTEPNVPSANELMSKAEVYIVESDPVLDYPRPMLPNVKLIGGVSAGPARDLQEPFKSFIEKSEKSGVGVAVFSLGSLYVNFAKNLEEKLVSVLTRLKLNTIWRANISSPDPNKILTSTWIPQNDLLGNKNVKVFLTHSGINSLYEGVYHGVPIVSLPLFYDQQFNMELIIDKGYGLGTDVLKATEDELVKTIEDVVSSHRIRSTIGKASQIYRELYKNPKQEAAFWLDHVMRYGGSYMRYSGQKIPMYLFVMDYFLVFLAGIVATLSFLFLSFIIIKIFSFWFRRTRTHFKKD